MIEVQQLVLNHDACSFCQLNGISWVPFELRCSTASVVLMLLFCFGCEFVQDKADAAAKEADTAKAAWQCRVCLTNEVDVAIVPCGHVLCRRCSSAVSRCPFCRLQVSKAMKIFRP